jgi:hypothetical protein
MSNLKDGIQKIAEDLTSLEINTIIAPNMTAGKMPHPRHALISIARDYDRALLEISNRLKLSGINITDTNFDVETGIFNFHTKEYSPKNNSRHSYVHEGSYNYFVFLRRFACSLLLDAEKQDYKEQKTDVVMLQRIRDSSDQIKGIFNAFKSRVSSKTVDAKTLQLIQQTKAKVQEEREKHPDAEAADKINYADKDINIELWDNNYTRTEIEAERPPFPLTSDEIVTIRKAWEINIEVIAMQTVIQLDGDVITRINPEYTTLESAMIRNIHNDCVNYSMNAWSQLVGLVKDFFEDIIKFFASPK